MSNGKAKRSTGDGGGVVVAISGGGIGREDSWSASAKEQSWALMDAMSKDEGSEASDVAVGDTAGKGGRTHLGVSE